MAAGGCAGTGDMGLMNTMPLCCSGSGLPQSGDWGAAKPLPGLEPEMRPRFCRVKLRMAGLGLWRRWACWAVWGEAAGLRRRMLVGVTSWAMEGLEPGEDGSNGYFWVNLTTHLHVFFDIY